MRKREAVKIIHKMKEMIKEGKVVKNSFHLYEDDNGNSRYSLIGGETNPTCGCLIGLWYLALNQEHDFDPFAKYIYPFVPEKYFTDDEDRELSFPATRVTKAGPKAMLSVLNKALKSLEV